MPTTALGHVCGPKGMEHIRYLKHTNDERGLACIWYGRCRKCRTVFKIWTAIRYGKGVRDVMLKAGEKRVINERTLEFTEEEHASI